MSRTTILAQTSRVNLSRGGGGVRLKSRKKATMREKFRVSLRYNVCAYVCGGSKQGSAAGQTHFLIEFYTGKKEGLSERKPSTDQGGGGASQEKILRRSRPEVENHTIDMDRRLAACGWVCQKEQPHWRVRTRSGFREGAKKHQNT